jgi:predicted regulator of Ras-like GTPase activity (Roadblock/LC7/MglB family)
MQRVRRIASFLAIGTLLITVGGWRAAADHEGAVVGTFTGCLDVAGKGRGKVAKIQAGQTPIGDACPSGFLEVHLSGGDVTAVTNGTGLEGGGSQGDITLALLPSFRLPQGCTTGKIASFNGSVWQCANDLIGNGDITSVGVGTGLSGGATSGDAVLALSPEFQLPQGCTAGHFVTWTGSAWMCASVGDLTSVGAGTGLTGGGTTGAVTLDLAVPYRLPQGCATHEIASWDEETGVWLCAAKPTEAAGPGFSRNTVAASGDLGEHTSITTGNDGLPVISYFDNTSDDLEVLHCNNVLCSSHTPTTIDSTGSVGEHSSIAIDAGRDPVISYYDTTNDRLKLARCDDAACTSSTTTNLGTIDGTDTSIAIGSDGFPVLSYQTTTATELEVLHCEDSDCTAFSRAFVDSEGIVGAHSSIAIGIDGLPIISYYDARTSTTATEDLNVAHCADVACLSRTITTLDATGNVGLHTSIAIGVDGLPVISYFDESLDDLKLARCSDLACTTATLTTLDSSGDVGRYSSIAIAGDGSPVVSYYDATSFDLNVAHCRDLACTSVNLTTVDPGTNVGTDSSIAIDSAGLPVIAYHNASTGDLKVAHCASHYCVPYQRGR